MFRGRSSKAEAVPVLGRWLSIKSKKRYMASTVFAVVAVTGVLMMLYRSNFVVPSQHPAAARTNANGWPQRAPDELVDLMKSYEAEIKDGSSNKPESKLRGTQTQASNHNQVELAFKDGSSAPEVKSSPPHKPKSQKSKKPKSRPAHDTALPGTPKGTLGTLTCNGQKVDSEVIYWREVPGDAEYESPVTPHAGLHKVKFMTHQYDQAGWNNMRMRMEILLVISHVLGRTIVSPPPQHLYLLSQPFDDPMRPGKKINWPSLGFDDFYDISLLKSHKGLHVMSMKEFLATEGTTGRLHTRDSVPLVPPGNKTDAWGKKLWKYLEEVADSQPAWNGKVVAFPATADEMKLINESHQAPLKLADLAPKMPAAEFEQLQRRAGVFTAGRQMTTYTREQQDAKLLHFPPMGQHRLLEHFYAFGFFADPNMQSYYKRLVRDYMRYTDVIQCAGHDLVKAIREDARSVNGGSDYYALHVRRGDFQFKNTKLSARQMLDNLNSGEEQLIPHGALVYISTDDPDGVCHKCLYKSKPCPTGAAAKGLSGCLEDPSWDAFREAGWEIRFLKDYTKKGVLKNTNVNFFGMIESIACSRAKRFAGTFYSTFTGYIHRLRGYHGIGEETYYHSSGRVNELRGVPSYGFGFTREWRSAWTDENGEPI